MERQVRQFDEDELRQVAEAVAKAQRMLKAVLIASETPPPVALMAMINFVIWEFLGYHKLGDETAAAELRYIGERFIQVSENPEQANETADYKPGCVVMSPSNDIPN